MKLSKNSLIYRSAGFQHSLWAWGIWNEYCPNDLCTFVKQYLIRMLIFTMATFVIAFAAISVLYFTAIVIFFHSLGDDIFAAGGFTMYMVGLIVVAVGGGYMLIDKWSHRDITPKEPGIIVSYYKAWKEKYCPTLEITE